MVPKSQRGQSGFSPVDNAYRIYDKVLDISLRMPKRYTYLVLQKMVDHAEQMASFVKEGNSIFPKNQQEAEMRRIFILLSHCSLQALSGQINVFLTHPQVLTHTIEGRSQGVKAGELEELAKMMNEEEKLLRDMLGKDAERYKNLPNEAGSMCGICKMYIPLIVRTFVA